MNEEETNNNVNPDSDAFKEQELSDMEDSQFNGDDGPSMSYAEARAANGGGDYQAPEDAPGQPSAPSQTPDPMARNIANDPALNGRASSGVVRTSGDLRTGELTNGSQDAFDYEGYMAQKRENARQNRLERQRIQAEAQAKLDSGEWYDTGRGYLRQKKYNKGFKRDGSGDRGVAGNRQVWRGGTTMSDGRAERYAASEERNAQRAQRSLDGAWDNAAGNVSRRNMEKESKMTNMFLKANKYAEEQVEKQKRSRQKAQAEVNMKIFDSALAALGNLMESEVKGRGVYEYKQMSDENDKNGRDSRWAYDENGRVTGMNPNNNAKVVARNRIGFVQPSSISAINSTMAQLGLTDYKFGGISARWTLDANGNKVGQPTFHANYTTPDGKQKSRVMTMNDIYDLGRDSYNIKYRKDDGDQSQIGDANYHAINALESVLGKYDDAVRGGLVSDMRGYKRSDVERQKREADIKYTEQRTQFASQDQEAKYHEGVLERLGENNNKLISAATKAESDNPERAEMIWRQVYINQLKMQKAENALRKIRSGGGNGGQQANPAPQAKTAPQGAQQAKPQPASVPVANAEAKPTAKQEQKPVPQAKPTAEKRLIKPPADKKKVEEMRQKSKDIREKNDKKPVEGQKKEPGLMEKDEKDLERWEKPLRAVAEMFQKANKSMYDDQNARSQVMRNQNEAMKSSAKDAVAWARKTDRQIEAEEAKKKKEVDAKKQEALKKKQAEDAKKKALMDEESAKEEKIAAERGAKSDAEMLKRVQRENMRDISRELDRVYAEAEVEMNRLAKVDKYEKAYSRMKQPDYDKAAAAKKAKSDAEMRAYRKHVMDVFNRGNQEEIMKMIDNDSELAALLDDISE